jgi:hypothetical protein
MILEILPRPSSVPLLGVPITVHPITLGDLADLQAWVRDNSWNCFEVPPDVSDPAMLWACVAARAIGWPPPIHTDLARMATGWEEYAAAWCHIAVGRKIGLQPNDSAQLSRTGPRDVLGWQAVLCAVYGESPTHAAHRWLNSLCAASEDGPEHPPPDWALLIGAFCREWKRLPAEVANLTLIEWRTLNALSVEAETGHYRLDRAGPPLPPGADRMRAKRERRELIAEAGRVVDDWERSRSGGTPHGQDGQHEGQPQGEGERTPGGHDAAQDGREADQQGQQD